MNLLLDDIRINPKRYVSISVFGKKGSNPPLMVPLPDTVSSPYIIKKVND
jgi:phospholipid/cholesterol/gamma-HCH transport system substrate-binding protein